MTKEKAGQRASAKANQGESLFDPIYMIDDAAALLEVSTRTTAVNFREGEIQAYKKMGKWYTMHSDLMTCL